jgi:hypothetical protein
MDWSDPEFVLALVAMALIASLVKTGIHACFGVPTRDRPPGHGGKRNRAEVDTLRSENSRLAERVEAYEDRIAVLERIVTDGSYRLGHEIEALRDDKGKVQ